jgi:hypothetical protein
MQESHGYRLVNKRSLCGNRLSAVAGRNRSHTGLINMFACLRIATGQMLVTVKRRGPTCSSASIKNVVPSFTVKVGLPQGAPSQRDAKLSMG